MNFKKVFEYNECEMKHYYRRGFIVASIYKKYGSSFKAKVAIEAIKEKKTIGELAQEYAVASSQITTWKQRLKGEASKLFELKVEKCHKEEVDKLHRIIGQITAERDFLDRAPIIRHDKKKLIIERSNEDLGIKRKCELLGVPRSSIYYQPKKLEGDDVTIMNEMRCIYQEKPLYGYRKITFQLKARGFCVNHKRVQQLLQGAGIRTIYPGKKTSIRNQQHKIFPYLLKGLKIERSNQVWQVDIT